MNKPKRRGKKRRGKPAARVTDIVVHAAPPKPTGNLIGIGSPNVFIGKLRAWRGVPTTVAPALRTTKKATLIAEANPATLASAKTTMFNTINSLSGLADKHTCVLHGVGVVINGSRTVLINKLPACRQGDTIVEISGPPTNKILKGCSSVFIGD